jgi:protein-disulfide isomerase-like protein with CxxC motif
MTMQTQTRWVYEWEDPNFYNMLVQEWETTAAWTGQTWQDYKAALLRQQGISLMSTAEYEMSCQQGVFPYILRS